MGFLTDMSRDFMRKDYLRKDYPSSLGIGLREGGYSLEVVWGSKEAKTLPRGPWSKVL